MSAIVGNSGEWKVLAADGMPLNHALKADADDGQPQPQPQLTIKVTGGAVVVLMVEVEMH